VNESSLRKLQKLVEKYLDIDVKAPSLETIEKDSTAQNRIADLLILLQVAMDSISQEGLDFDKDYLVELPKTEIQERINALTEFLYTGYLDEKTTYILD
jgi:hypothetical protein